MTDDAEALRYADRAERDAAFVPGMTADVPARDVSRVAVIGAGTMGAGIATCFALAGLPVVLVDDSGDALERAASSVRRNAQSAVKRGRLAPDALDATVGLVTCTRVLDDVAACDFAVEAVFEDMAVKQSVFAKLAGIARPGAILATNTSTLDVDRIAAVTGRAADVVGTHFFSPAHVMRLFEVVRGASTAPDVLATTMRLGKRIGKVAVVAGVCDGFIGNRMLEQYMRQATFLLEEGASPSQVDAALEAFGMAMGPFRMHDLAGNDIGWHIRKRRYVESPHITYSRVADRLCEQGRYGQKTGAGWYRYEPGGRDAMADPAVDALIAAHRRDAGVAPRAIDDAEIVDRCVLSLVNEGARLLDEGIALRASDIDAVYLAGYGFPRTRGGPMHFADALGAAEVIRRMHRLAALPRADVAFWQPAPLLARLAAEGGRLTS